MDWETVLIPKAEGICTTVTLFIMISILSSYTWPDVYWVVTHDLMYID